MESKTVDDTSREKIYTINHYILLENNMISIKYNDLKKQYQVTAKNTRITDGGCSCNCYAPDYDYYQISVEYSKIRNIYGDNEFNNILNLATSAANSK